MQEKIKKYRSKSKIYFALLILSVVLQFVLLVNQFTISNLPLSIALLSLFDFLLIYLIYNVQKDISKLLVNGKDKKDLTQDEHADIDSGVSKEHTEISKLNFDKTLFKGITKKAQKKIVYEKFLSNLVKTIEAEIGLFYTFNKKSKTFQIEAKYAYFSDENPPDFKIGEGLSGQVAKNQKAMRINNIPETHLTIISGLGKGKPKNIIIYPVIINESLFGIIELASFVDFPVSLETELTDFFNTNSEKFINVNDS